MGNPYSESWRRKRKGCGREDLQKRKDLSLEWVKTANQTRKCLCNIISAAISQICVGATWRLRRLNRPTNLCDAPTKTMKIVANNDATVFSFRRHLTTWHCSHLRPPLSIDISCTPGPQQQTRRTLLQRWIDGWDRQTDGRTPYRYIDPGACAEKCQ